MEDFIDFIFDLVGDMLMDISQFIFDNVAKDSKKPRLYRMILGSVFVILYLIFISIGIYATYISFISGDILKSIIILLISLCAIFIILKFFYMYNMSNN